MAKLQKCRCHETAATRPPSTAVWQVATDRPARAVAPLRPLAVASGGESTRRQIARLMQAQRFLGNRAAQRLARRIQRKKLTEADKAQDLQSDALKNDARLQQAFDNSPLLLQGETSEGVKTLQRALRDLGYPMPISFAKTGDADGIFGGETRSAVLKFQTDRGLVYKDGIVGRETLQTMDQLLGKGPGPTPTPTGACHFDYQGGAMSDDARAKFLQDHFEARDRVAAKLILDDLCDVEQDRLSFATEDELRDEVMMRLKVSEYMKTSQTSGGFAYPESAKDCPGKTGNALADAQVNVDARAYWNGPILEQRAAVKNAHYFFELTTDVGMKDGYQALKLLFNAKTSICDKTLIHCDTLITMTKALAYADTIGKDNFNAKIASGQLSMWLTYDGMSIRDNDKAATPVSVEFQAAVPSSERELIIGDHVTFWNHLAYDAIAVGAPGPWRLENALLVDKDRAGTDLFEGHGAPSDATHMVRPGPKEDVHKELMNAYNPYAKQALALTARVDRNEPGAAAQLAVMYPQVMVFGGHWWIRELDRNAGRARRFYELRELTGPDDPEIVGLRNPDNPTRLNWVNRPVESK